jgi:hypothetical protein
MGFRLIRIHRGTSAEDVMERAREVLELCLDRRREISPEEAGFLRSLKEFRTFSPKQLKWLRGIAYRFQYEIPEEREADWPY